MNVRIVQTENRYVLHPQGLKRCSKCLQIKPFKDFPIKSIRRVETSKYNTHCKICHNKETRERVEKIKQEPKEYCKHIITNLKHRAKTRDIKFNLSAEYLFEQWQKQKGKCFYTDEPMNLAAKSKHLTPHIDFPSLDRLDPAKGYVKGNVVWCKYGINRMKNDFTKEQFISFCKNISNRFTV